MKGRLNIARLLAAAYLLLITSLTVARSIPVAMYLNAKGHKLAYAWLGGVVLSLASWPLLGFGLGERLTVYLEVIWLISLRARPKAWASQMR